MALTMADKSELNFSDVTFKNFTACWITPVDSSDNGIILYIHGGGYVAGDLEYAKGFGAVLASKHRIPVLCAAYRLAPEHPFPAALEDVEVAYRYLLKSGYDSGQIILCGESAGGGLIYALTLKLQAMNLPLPCGLIAISPWSDLTMSGASYTHNCNIDPSMSRKRLVHYAAQYTSDVRNPYVSPLFGTYQRFPPSLIFVGGDEVMLDDAVQLHEKLRAGGNTSTLITAPGMWHAYLLYNLKERRQDHREIGQFIQKHVRPKVFRSQWMRLDNAAKIYPAAMRKNWSNVFRLSVTLTDPIDPDILQSSLEVTVKRFPSISVRLRRGLFWYYIDQIEHAPAVRADAAYPITPMRFKEVRQCALRVLYYKNRIAVEFFHALTDGNGGLVFLKTLTAEYLEQRYGIEIPAGQGVLDRAELPSAAELEDSFLKYSGVVSAGRSEANAYRIRGTKIMDDYHILTCFILSVQEILTAAKSYDTTLTGFIASVLIAAIIDLQNETMPNRRKQKPVKVLIPVNLRQYFASTSLRNFVLYTTPGIDPRIGEYTFDEIVRSVRYQMGLELTGKRMSTKITANVRSERALALRVMPLFIKNLAMKLVYSMVGERKSCLTLSNLGAVRLPEEMSGFIKRMDFILGEQATRPNNCGILSYGDTLYMNFIRNIEEPFLEYKFYHKLKSLGIHVKVESNQR